MEEVSESTKNVAKEKIGFLKFVFNMDDDNKALLLNMLQYAMLGLIPCLLLLKVIKEFVPEADEDKESIKILAESVGQIVVLFLGIWFIHKMITFIPTYSGTDYSMFNEISFVLAFLICLFTMETTLGIKLHFLIDRIFNLWNGTATVNNNGGNGNGGGKNVVKVTQPLSHQPSQADNLGNHPGFPQPPIQPSVPTQQVQDFNSMYTNPSQNAEGMQQEPMAANDGFSGAFGSSF